VAVCVFPGEQYQAPRSWIDRASPNPYNQVDEASTFSGIDSV